MAHKHVRINELTETISLSPRSRHNNVRTTNQSKTQSTTTYTLTMDDKSDSDNSMDFNEDGEFKHNQLESDMNGIQQSINTPKSPSLISGNPAKWDWKLVKLWLIERELSPMIEVFKDKGIDGEMLLSIDREILWKDYNIKHILDISNRKQAAKHPVIARFLRELPALKLRAISQIKGEDKYGKESTIYDVFEMKRRIREFTCKWDRILWIEYYVETNNKTPTKETISSELEISISKSLIYLDYYQNMEKFKEKDLKELLGDFNVYNDCIIWWYIIINKLKTYPQKSLWLIFSEIAKITPHKVALELLSVYGADLTRFEADQLHKVTQNIVIGSEYPICTALRIAKWFIDRAEFDIARGI